MSPETMEMIQQMSKTIDDFRHFFKPDKEKVDFRVLEAIERALSLVEGNFKERRHRYRNHSRRRSRDQRLSQPIQPGSSQHSDQCQRCADHRKVDKPAISIRLMTEGSKTVVTITDNAGGIPEEIIGKIFEPYFTTKGPEQGTGIGLFMCKTIIEKNMDGALSARNISGGAEFRIEV